MRCERLIKCCVLLLLAAACSREAPAPAAQDSGATTSTAPPIAPAPTIGGPTYDQAITWFRTTPGFSFVVEESGTRAVGDMERTNVGAERVRMTIGGDEWTAEAGPKGVIWKRGGSESAPPEMGNRLWQRVTLAFDPEKREGQAQLVEPGHFRFTDANSGAVHDLWVADDGRITKMTIGKSVSMTLSAQR